MLVNEDSVSSGFHFENVTMKTHVDDRLPQRILIDIGVLEEDPVFQVKLNITLFFNVNKLLINYQTLNQAEVSKNNSFLFFDLKEIYSQFHWCLRIY